MKSNVQSFCEIDSDLFNLKTKEKYGQLLKRKGEMLNLGILAFNWINMITSHNIASQTICQRIIQAGKGSM